jgi:deazaflavin-dependent oxidoreductase (nitroreductase family)
MASGKGIWGKFTSSDLGRIPKPGTPLFRVWKVIQDTNTRLYRLSGGRIGGKYDDAPVLILHHVGRKSGQPRETPLIYLQDGDDIVIVGSMGGSEKHPAWYFNVRDRPDEVEVEIKGRRTPVAPRRVTPEERERLWPALLEMWPAWEAYTKRTDREFPVLILSPAGDLTGPGA